MKLPLVLSLVLPVIKSTTLTYPDNISLFKFDWSNPDQGNEEGYGPTDATLLTDGDTTIGSGETITKPAGTIWGTLSSSTTVGMVGSFRAWNLSVDTGYSYWSISKVAVVFDSGSCFSSNTTAVAYYYDRTTQSEETLSVTTTTDDTVYTFSADITTALETNGYIGFDIFSYTVCEGEIAILEYILEGEQIATPSPTTVLTTGTPTTSPTASPTTASPTEEVASGNDFRLGIQLAEGSYDNIKKEGEIRYTPYLQTSSDWSVYAGDSNYYDGDAFRIGIFPLNNDTNGFSLVDTDIRFGIQLTDKCSDETGNPDHEGDVQYTPWASEQGGWSEFAGDSNYYDFDAVRVVIETQDAPGLVISNIQIGAWLTDLGVNMDKAGDPIYSNWLTASGNGGWSDWGSDNNWYDPDSIALYMGVETNYGVTVNVNAAFTASSDDSSSDGLSADAIAIIVCTSVLCFMASILAVVFYLKKREKVLVAGVEPVEDVDEEVITGKSVVAGSVGTDGLDGLTPIGMKSTHIGSMEEDIMIEVEVTETND